MCQCLLPTMWPTQTTLTASYSWLLASFTKKKLIILTFQTETQFRAHSAIDIVILSNYTRNTRFQESEK